MSPYDALIEICDLTQTDPCTWRASNATVEGYQLLVDKIYDVAIDAIEQVMKEQK